MGLAIDVIHDLCGKRQPQQQGSAPVTAPCTERERAIIVASAVAEPIAARVERNQRQQDDIHPSGTQLIVAAGFGDTDTVAAQWPGMGRNEPHAATAQGADPRQV